MKPHPLSPLMLAVHYAILGLCTAAGGFLGLRFGEYADAEKGPAMGMIAGIGAGMALGEWAADTHLQRMHGIDRFHASSTAASGASGTAPGMPTTAAADAAPNSPAALAAALAKLRGGDLGRREEDEGLRGGRSGEWLEQLEQERRQRELLAGPTREEQGLGRSATTGRAAQA